MTVAALDDDFGCDIGGDQIAAAIGGGNALQNLQYVFLGHCRPLHSPRSPLA